MEGTPPTLLVRILSGKNKYQMFFMAYLLLTGFLVSVTAPEPESMNALYPQWVIATWGASLAIGAAANFVGVLWRGMPETGIRIEMVSSSIIATANLVWPMALVVRLFTVPDGQAARLQGSWIILGLLFTLSLAAFGSLRDSHIALREVRDMRKAIMSTTGEVGR